MRNHVSLAILLLAMLSGLYAFDYAQNSQLGVEKSSTGYSIWDWGNDDTTTEEEDNYYTTGTWNDGTTGGENDDYTTGTWNDGTTGGENDDYTTGTWNDGTTGGEYDDYTTGTGGASGAGTTEQDTEDTPVDGNTPNPEIVSFTANPKEVTTKQTSTLNWKVTNAFGCSIYHKDDSQVYKLLSIVSGRETYPVTPVKTTTYRLNCYKEGGVNVKDDVTREVTITVTGTKTTTPTTTTGNTGTGTQTGVSTQRTASFTADPKTTTIQKGETATLAWEGLDVKGYDSCEINNIDPVYKSELKQGTRQVKPQETKKYTLECYKILHSGVGGTEKTKISDVTITVTGTTTTPTKGTGGTTGNTGTTGGSTTQTGGNNWYALSEEIFKKLVLTGNIKYEDYLEDFKTLAGGSPDDIERIRDKRFPKATKGDGTTTPGKTTTGKTGGSKASGEFKKLSEGIYNAYYPEGRITYKEYSEAYYELAKGKPIPDAIKKKMESTEKKTGLNNWNVLSKEIYDKLYLTGNIKYEDYLEDFNTLAGGSTDDIKKIRDKRFPDATKTTTTGSTTTTPTKGTGGTTGNTGTQTGGSTTLKIDSQSNEKAGNAYTAGKITYKEYLEAYYELAEGKPIPDAIEKRINNPKQDKTNNWRMLAEEIKMISDEDYKSAFNALSKEKCVRKDDSIEGCLPPDIKNKLDKVGKTPYGGDCENSYECSTRICVWGKC